VAFWADPEKSYTLESADALSGSTWTTLTNIAIRPAPVFIEVAVPITPGNHFLRLRTP
jgi:hypothetical protein